MNGAKLQERIYKRYAHFAAHGGVDCTLHRPTNALSPLPSSIGTIRASFNAEDFYYNKPNKYGKSTWFGIFDGRLTHVGDYLQDGNNNYWFIAAMQLNLPILCVECNRTITIYEHIANTGVGNIGYSGMCSGSGSSETSLGIMAGWKCSILRRSRGMGSLGLPMSGKDSPWEMLMPAFDGIIINAGMLAIDDLSRRYIIDAAELTDLGWRILLTEEHT